MRVVNKFGEGRVFVTGGPLPLCWRLGHEMIKIYLLLPKMQRMYIASLARRYGGPIHIIVGGSQTMSAL